MHPILFRIGGFAVPTYGALFVTGILGAILLGRHQARRKGLSTERATDFLFWALIGGLIGARLLFLVILVADRGWGGFSWSEVFFGAGVFYGGLAGFFGGFVVCSRWYDFSLWDYADVCFPGVVFAHALGRIGCFMAGCCYGSPTNSFLSVTFTNPVSGATFGTPLGVPLHPVQLYEAAGEVAIGIVLLVLLERRSYVGQILPAYLLLYSPLRFGLEFIRNDFRGEWFGGALSTSQVLAIVAIPVGLALGAWLRRRHLQPAVLPARSLRAGAARR